MDKEYYESINIEAEDDAYFAEFRAELDRYQTDEEGTYILIDVYSEQADDDGCYSVVGQRKEYV